MASSCFYGGIQAAESLLCRSQHYSVKIYLHTDTFLRRSIEESGYELPVSYGHQALRDDFIRNQVLREPFLKNWQNH